LAGLLLPALQAALSKARRTSCANNLHQIGMGFHSYLQDYGEVFPAADDPVSATPAYWLWMGRGWRPLLDPYMVNETRAFWCPVDTTAVQKYSSTSYSYSMSFYHTPEQINAIAAATGTYSNPPPTVPQRLGRVRTPDKKILAGEWLSNHCRIDKDGGWWTWEGSRVFLFVDGRIEYRSAASLLAANDGWPDANLTRDGLRGADVP
jgi:hypothetical protein